MFDEPENELLVLLVSEQLKVWIESFRRRHRGWKGKSWKERFELYQLEVRSGEVPKHRDNKVPDFEFINELMQVDLDEVEAIDVDYEAIPFGCDQKGRGIYSPQHGKRFSWGLNSGWRIAKLVSHSSPPSHWFRG